MFARVTTLQLQSGKLDAFLRIFQDEIAPIAAAQPGFGGITLLTDPQLGKVVAFSLWVSEADLLASERSYYQAKLAESGRLLAAAPVSEAYEVSAQVDLIAEGAAHIRGI